jgi:hypothetical protein
MWGTFKTTPTYYARRRTETMKTEHLLIAFMVLSTAMFTILHETAHAEICRIAGGNATWHILPSAGGTTGIVGVYCNVSTQETKLANMMNETTYTQMAIITAIFLAAACVIKNQNDGDEK